ncbi:MAG: T9SS type A sorting domain-containing protein [Bacteroidia bacterium]|nr:T9SS type A sorting domain-containing protein [Bacteroidia bacterium]
MKFTIFTLLALCLSVSSWGQTSDLWFAHAGGKNLNAQTGQQGSISSGFIIGGISTSSLNAGFSSIGEVRIGFYDCSHCNKSFVSNVSILNLNGIFVYPNPANSQLTIESKRNSIFQFSISTMEGKIYTRDKFSSPKTISLEGIPSGIYIIRIEDEHSGRIYNEKLIIK